MSRCARRVGALSTAENLVSDAESAVTVSDTNGGRIAGCGRAGVPQSLSETSQLPESLAAVLWARDRIRSEEQRLVVAARAGGASWQAIGSRLGVSREAAWRRFRNLDTRARLTTGDSCADQALNALAYLPITERMLDSQVETLVARARSRGWTWETIAGVMGLRKQSVWERYRYADSAERPVR